MRSLVIGAPSVFLSSSTRPATDTTRFIGRTLLPARGAVNRRGRTRRMTRSDAAPHAADAVGERVGGGEDVVTGRFASETDADVRQGAALGVSHREDRVRRPRVARAARGAGGDRESAAADFVAHRLRRAALE